MRYVLDTCVLMANIRGTNIYETIEQENDLLNNENQSIISVVTKGEILALGSKNAWGARKMEPLRALLRTYPIINIEHDDEDLINAYLRIDAFSQNRLPELRLGRSVTMGKNDLWIAATAFVTGSTLLTLDGDFDHLDGVIIPVKKYVVAPVNVPILQPAPIVEVLPQNELPNQ